MFRKMCIEDSINIPSSSIDHFSDILYALDEKYINKVIPNYGIAMKTIQVNRIIETEVLEDYLLPLVEAELLIFQPIIDEVLECIISKQNDLGIFCDHLILGEIFIKVFFANTEPKIIFMKNSTEKNFLWCWNYRNNNFFFKNNQKIRCKISKISYSPFAVEARVDETGLGPIE